jgi:hypothetical protein
MELGKIGARSDLLLDLTQHRGHGGQGGLESSMTAMVSTCSRTNSPVGWAKMVRIAAATMWLLPFVTFASTLRMKCTRQRCQAAPIMVASWRSSARDDGRRSPAASHQTALAQTAQELRPERLRFGVPDRAAEDCAAPVGAA